MCKQAADLFEENINRLSRLLSGKAIFLVSLIFWISLVGLNHDPVLGNKD